jgi:glycosidase
VDAITGTAGTPEERAQRFLASQAVMLSLPGVPGIYIGSLIGSTNWEEGVRLTGANRSINRQKLPLDQVMAEIGTPGTFRHLVFDGYLRMLTVRGRSRAFDPAGGMEVLPAEGSVFAVMRHAPRGKGQERVLCVINTGNESADFFLPRGLFAAGEERRLVDLVDGNEIEPEGTGDRLVLRLEPLAVHWLTC